MSKTQSVRTLSDAEEIEVVSFDQDGMLGKHDATDKLQVGRWTKHGHDRLYINEGVPKADKYSLYVDLDDHSIHSDNTTKHSGGSVEIDGDTAVVIIEESGDKQHTITLDIEWEN